MATALFAAGMLIVASLKDDSYLPYVKLELNLYERVYCFFYGENW